MCQGKKVIEIVDMGPPDPAFGRYVEDFLHAVCWSTCMNRLQAAPEKPKKGAPAVWQCYRCGHQNGSPRQRCGECGGLRAGQED